MKIAVVSSLRSEDPHTQVGCCILNKEGKVVSTGCNGLKGGEKYDPNWSREEKLSHMIHAETNAFSLIKRGDGHTIYVTKSPCDSCCQNIIAHDIKRVVYLDEYHRGSKFKEIFKKNGITFEKANQS